MKKIIYTLYSSLIITSCSSSYHNINERGPSALGGGFQDREVETGMHFIIAKTNFQPWVSFDGAYKTFNRRAAELCGEESYKVLEQEEASYPHAYSQGELDYTISQVSGYVLCTSSPINDIKAKEIIVSDSKNFWFTD